MTDTSGPTYGKQFATYDPDSQSWKMWPATGLWGSIEYSETWPRTGCMSGGQAYELPPSEHPTTASDFSSSQHLPTPVAQPSGNTQENHLRKKPGRETVTDLAIIVENDLLKSGGKVLPTPTSSDWKRDASAPSDMARKSPSLTVVEKHFPTPTASDATGGTRAKGKQGGDSLRTIAERELTSDPTPPLFDGGSG